MRHIKYILLLLILSSTSTIVHSQQLAVKTNGLMLLALTPNIEFEMVTGEHSSINLGAFGHYKPYGLESKMMGLQAEYRYWFNGRPMTREYIGVGALGTSYRMKMGDYIYDGDAVGLGLTAGYTIMLGKKLNLEFYGGFGFLTFKQKYFYKEDTYEDYFHDDRVTTNSKGLKLFPTKLGVSISYILH